MGPADVVMEVALSQWTLCPYSGVIHFTAAASLTEAKGWRHQELWSDDMQAFQAGWRTASKVKTVFLGVSLSRSEGWASNVFLQKENVKKQNKVEKGCD